MAIGKRLGSFRAKSTSVTLKPGEGDMPLAEINYEGTVTGKLDGALYATMNFNSKDGRSGTYTITSLLILSNGDIIGASGHGTTSHIEDQKWNVVGVSNVSKSNSFAVKAMIDLENDVMKGDLFAQE